MTHISGSTKQLLILLEEAFAAGYHAGTGEYFAGYDYLGFWEEYKKEHLSEYEED